MLAKRFAIVSATALCLMYLLSPAARAAENMQPLQWKRIGNMSFMSGGIDRERIYVTLEKPRRSTQNGDVRSSRAMNTGSVSASNNSG